MQHLHDRASLEQFLARVKMHLLPGGIFAVDVFNPSISILARDRSERYEVMKLEDPETSLEASIEETIHYDAESQVNRVKWYYSVGPNRDVKVDELNMRCFFPQELDMLMHYNGFEVTQKYGNFDKSPFKSSSPKQILLLRTR